MQFKSEILKIVVSLEREAFGIYKGITKMCLPEQVQILKRAFFN